MNYRLGIKIGGTFTDFACCPLTSVSGLRQLRVLPSPLWSTGAMSSVVRPMTLACCVEIKGDRMNVDFNGSASSVHRRINMPFGHTNAMVRYAANCLTAPEGCLLNAQPPSPTGGRHIIGHFVVPLIFGTLGGRDGQLREDRIDGHPVDPKNRQERAPGDRAHWIRLAAEASAHRRPERKRPFATTWRSGWKRRRPHRPITASTSTTLRKAISRI